MTDAVLAEINETLKGIHHELQKMNEPQKTEQTKRHKGKQTKEEVMRRTPPDLEV